MTPISTEQRHPHDLTRKYGPDFYKEMGRRGGKKTKEKHGSEHYTAIGRKGGFGKAQSAVSYR